MSCKNRNYKSAQVAVNTTAQTITATGTTVGVLGNLATNTGCSVETNGDGFKINASGLYNVRYAITFTAGEAGTLTAQLFKDGVALPCALAQNTVAAGNVYTVIVEAPAIVVGACCNICPNITAVVSGVAGTVNYVSASVVRLA